MDSYMMNPFPKRNLAAEEARADLLAAMARAERAEAKLSRIDSAAARALDYLNMEDGPEYGEALKVFREALGLCNAFACACGWIGSETTGFRCPVCGDGVVSVVVQKDVS